MFWWEIHFVWCLIHLARHKVGKGKSPNLGRRGGKLHLLSIRTRFKGYLIQSPQRHGGISVTGPILQTRTQALRDHKWQSQDKNPDLQPQLWHSFGASATLSLQSSEWVNSRSRTRDPQDPGVLAQIHGCYLVSDQHRTIVCPVGIANRTRQ